ncbi:type II toxin-antitoxin system TacA family antitoxin [Pararhodospirillum oryzae]|uniref:DUF1778 domain-containing protein n=1 Tax=Pararhodospirillum oryzae TaxID=478448 RepID=A0A512H809_9PROT|nr:DUF1778 domain-containing protein [Pararhodospirillum oryzae]GEO81597.1 hypothetical protein ROR02_17280 [Pararhodospirillum oryzae]
MPRAAGTKDDRLQVRLDAASKSVLQRAASYRHKTVSQFVLATAMEEAEKVIRESEVVTLSSPDWTLFYEALTNPPAPNTALRKAFATYQKTNG